MRNIFTNKVISFLFAGSVLVASPLSVYADHTNEHTIEQLQAQITALQAQITVLLQQLDSSSGSTKSIAPVSCPRFTYNFYLGMEDNDTEGQITELQKILAVDSEVYPEALITGYYGPFTEQAVRRYQKKHSIVSSGSPDTTGYGVVGPATRARLSQGCGQTVVPPPIIPSPTPLSIPNPSQKAPTISGISGPPSLKVGETGTWTIKASDPSGGTLSYYVLWGDETPDIRASAHQNRVQTTSFTHVYSREGVFTPVFTVTNSAGFSERTNTRVAVISEQAVTLSRDARRVSDVKMLQLVLEMYWDAKQSYPSSLYVLAPDYIQRLPEDPLGNMYHYVTLPSGCAGTAASPCSGYHMGSSIETSTHASLRYDADYDSTSLPGGINGSDHGSCRPIGAGIMRYCYDVKEGIASSSPSITVLSPKEGDVWKIGENRQISWQTSGVTSPNDKMTIYIVPTGDLSKNYNLAQEIPNTGSYNYVVDDPVTFIARSPLYAAGGQFKIFVCARLLNNQDLCSNGIGYSNAFSIVSSSTPASPSITVLSPNGGEIWQMGATHTVRWGTSNYPANTPVSVVLLKRTSQNPMVYDAIQILAEATANDGTENFLIPTFVHASTTPNDYFVQVGCVSGIYPNGCRADMSDAPFSIIAPTPKSDLTVSDIYNDMGKLSIKVQNIGVADAPVDTGHLFIWIDDQLKWTYSVSTWSNKDYRLVGGTTVVQPQVLTGSHKIKATIDARGLVVESNENNNTLEKIVAF